LNDYKEFTEFASVYYEKCIHFFDKVENLVKIIKKEIIINGL
jgi:hypothetical protein